MTKELLLYLFGGGGTLGAIVLAWIKYKTKKLSKEGGAQPSAPDLSQVILSEVLTTLQGMEHILQMGFKLKVNESHQEIMQLKKLAWCKQQDDLYHGLKRIIRANGLVDKKARISDIRDLLETVIRTTDEILNGFNLKGYLAPTADKILFVCGGPAPEVLYKIITDEKNKDYQKLEDSIRGYGRKILNSIRSEFYDGNGRVKEPIN